MISPVVVACRGSGLVAAWCHRTACIPGWPGPTHVLYAGMDLRAAERAADDHLKVIRAEGAQ